MTEATTITGRQALAEGLTIENPPTHLTVLLESAGGRVRADWTLEVDDETDVRDLWETQWDYKLNESVPTGELEHENNDAVSFGMAAEILDALVSACSNAHVPATWEAIDDDNIAVVAWLSEGFELVLEHCYDDEGKFRLEDLPGVKAWRWHTADDPESLLGVPLDS